MPSPPSSSSHAPSPPSMNTKGGAAEDDADDDVGGEVNGAVASTGEFSSNNDTDILLINTSTRVDTVVTADKAQRRVLASWPDRFGLLLFLPLLALLLTLVLVRVVEFWLFFSKGMTCPSSATVTIEVPAT